MKAPTFTDVKVVGMHFRERDGVPAKAIVANMVPPVQLELEREPGNRFDAYACKVMYQGQHIGYIEASSACFLSPWLDSGNKYSCTVDQLIEVKNILHPLVTLTPVSDADSA